MFIPVQVKEFGIAFAATLLLPLVVLSLDYYIRAAIESGSFPDQLQQSGPDCCILSLGATGAIFVDPTVSAVNGMKSPIFIIFLVIFLIFMRVGCIRARKAATHGKTASSLRYGVCSLLTVFFVMVYGYMATWIGSPL